MYMDVLYVVSFLSDDDLLSSMDPVGDGEFAHSGTCTHSDRDGFQGPIAFSQGPSFGYLES